MGPNLTESIFALGKGSSLVGCDIFSKWPPEASSIARVGGIVDPSMEVIISLKPDLIILQGEHLGLRKFAEKRKIRYISYQWEGVEGILSGLMELSELLGVPEKGAELIAEMRRDFDGPKPKSPVKVLISLGMIQGDGAITTVNNETFLGELVELAGGSNVFGKLPVRYPNVPIEEVLQADPDYILEMIPGYPLTEQEKKSRNAFWKRWKSLSAVKKDKIFYLDQDFLLIPGPRIHQTWQVFQKILQSEKESAPLKSKP